MTKQTSDQPNDEKRSSEYGAFPEFLGPAVENFQFLVDDHEWRGPFFKSVGRECTLSFKSNDIGIELAYEPLTLPWGYVKRPGKGAVALNELLTKWGFRLDERKYREYDEAREKLFALLSSPKEADEYAKTNKAIFHHAVEEYVKDIGSFLREHFTEAISAVD